MKKIVLALVLVLVVIWCSEACVEKQWRGHKVLCCENGSAVFSKNKQWIWTEERPLVCGFHENNFQSKPVAIASIAAIVIGTMACVACHL